MKSIEENFKTLKLKKALWNTLKKVFIIIVWKETWKSFHETLRTRLKICMKKTLKKYLENSEFFVFGKAQKTSSKAAWETLKNKKNLKSFDSFYENYENKAFGKLIWSFEDVLKAFRKALAIFEMNFHKSSIKFQTRLRKL